MRLLVSVLSVVLLLGACASPGKEAGYFGYAAATPLRDLNIGNPEVPGQLAALRNPFGYASPTCQAVEREIAALQGSIVENNRRYPGYRRPTHTRGGRVGNAWDVGVSSAATYWIPFRGLVRQVSGAAKRDARAQAASDRARYRVGYLVGQARAYQCPGFA